MIWKAWAGFSYGVLLDKLVAHPYLLYNLFIHRTVYTYFMLSSVCVVISKSENNSSAW